MSCQFAGKKLSLFILPCFLCLLEIAGRADDLERITKPGMDSATQAFLDDVVNQPEMDPSVSWNLRYRSEIQAGLQALPTMHITTEATNLFGLQGIYKNPFKTGPDWERSALVEYFDPKSHEEFRLKAGLRIHGDDSRGHVKKPFSLHFRRKYGSGKLHFPLFPNSPVKKFDKLVLRSGGHDAWTSPLGYGLSQAISATYIRDEFLRSSQEAMGHPAVRGRFLHLFLNGKYWGLYNAVEAVDAKFMSSHLGGTKEDWDVVRGPDSGPFIVAGTNTAWNAMMTIAEAGVTNPAAFEQIQSYLDLDNLIDFMILRIWAGDLDWLRSRSEPTTGSRSKDWFAARNRRSESKFIFFVWDAEISMGKDHDVNRRVNVNIADADVGNSPGRLYTKLRQNPGESTARAGKPWLRTWAAKISARGLVL